MQVGTFYLIGPGIINKKSQLLEKTFLTFFKQMLTELLSFKKWPRRWRWSSTGNLVLRLSLLPTLSLVREASSTDRQIMTQKHRQNLQRF